MLQFVYRLNFVSAPARPPICALYEKTIGEKLINVVSVSIRKE